MSFGAEAALIEASLSISQFGIAVARPMSAFAFFKSLDDALVVLGELGAFEEAEGLTRHIDYLASKVACPPAVILAGEPFAAERKINPVQQLPFTPPPARLRIIGKPEWRPRLVGRVSLPWRAR